MSSDFYRLGGQTPPLPQSGQERQVLPVLLRQLRRGEPQSGQLRPGAVQVQRGLLQPGAVRLKAQGGLARLVRSEVLQLRQAPYFRAARRLGISRRKLLQNHLLPHLLPQFLTGLLLQFPHAILHEAGVTFLGFGLSPEQPAIGIILAESMAYLSTGRWWLALFPGLSLVLVVAMFALAGERLRLLLAPASAQE